MEGCSSTRAETFKHYKPSPAQHHKKYHVFLSFRGMDVRNTLVDHLFNSLSTAGFHVFVDSERLEKGKNIEVIPVDAIRNSTVHIPIFSANYASSPRCLNELSLMWTCKSTCTETTIIPLFYNVKPSDVRYPDNKGLYAQAFQEHRAQGRHSEMEAWRKALHQVSLLSGWSLPETAGGYEGKLVKLVVMDLCKTLRIKDLDIPKHLEGVSDRMEEVTNLVDMNDHSRPVLCVGIWGMGGLGKTTLAKAVYNSINLKFEESCFVSDVRALTKGSVQGLLELQKQIVRDLLKVNESTLKKLNTVAHAKIQMKNLLRYIKALVILDDVDDEQQLDALVGDAFNGYWFGAGSRIIVTTRNSQVWKRHRHSSVIQYSMRGLDPTDGLKVFSWHAFMRPGPAEGYEEITKKIVDACQGLPLSLEVVGARLYSEKRLEIWEEALTNLVKGHQKVYSTLKISYDALSCEEKRMFLDIVCFFLVPMSFPRCDVPSSRYDMKFYVKLWKALECSAPRTCLTNLEMKSLIRINYDWYHSDSSLYDWYHIGYSIFWMHDHLRDMGRQIIEEASPSNLAERSRFWRHKDFVTAMDQTQGMPNVEGVVMDFHPAYCSTIPWALMTNLKFMVVSDLLCQGGRTKLPPNLKFLCLWSCRFQKDGLRASFCLPSKTQRVSFRFPKTIGELKSLRFLDMTDTSIYRLPNEVGELVNLEELYLSRCNLRKLSQSFANLINLKVLDISYNYHINSFPAKFHLPSSLIELHLKGCSNLQKIPGMSHMKKLEALDVSKCTSLTELPSLDSMPSLRDLQLGGCEELQALPALPDSLTRLDLSGCHMLQDASSISHPKKLEALDLFGCTSLTELPSLDSMHSLRDLMLRGCKELQALPALPDTLSHLCLKGCRKLQEVSCISHLKKLKNLDVSGCTSLRELPSSIYHLQKLENLDVSGCTSLTELPSSISHLNKLERLHVSKCKSLTELPSLDSMHSLRDLELRDCRELQALPALPDTFSYLYLNGCRKLQEVSSISHLKKLEKLDVSGCSLTELPSLDFMHSLRNLQLGACEELEALPALPDTLCYLDLHGCRKLREASSISPMKKLKALNVSWCTSLTELPSLDSMHSLRDLKLWSCVELQALPALPDTLSYLDLSGCRKLQDASSISHMKNLKALDLSGCTSLTELPSLDFMHSLRDLKLKGCEELQALPALPNTLSYLDLRDCEELQALPALPDTLSYLDLSGCRKLQDASSISNVKNLKALDLSGCTSLTELPSLDFMHSLRDLKPRGCEELQALPALPNTLSRLDFNGCRKLREASSISHMKKLKTWLHMFCR